MILTDNGYEIIQDLQDKSCNVWNGEEFSSTTVRFTGDSMLYRVILSNGMQLDCTPKHKWFMQTGDQLHLGTCKRSVIFTEDLKVNDAVYEYETPLIVSIDCDEYQNPYMHGLFCGAGYWIWKDSASPVLRLDGEKKKLAQYIHAKTVRDVPEEDSLILSIDGCMNKPKFFVPVNYSMDTKLRFLEGISDADGMVNNGDQQAKNGTSIQISNSNKRFLQDIQLMLTTMGVTAQISQSHSDENGSMSKHTLNITCEDVTSLINLGFSPKRLHTERHSNALTMTKKHITVMSITKLPGIHKTYCFSEPKKHAGIFNGVLTGQSEAYSLLIDTLITDPKDRDLTFNAIKHIPCIQKKADWCFNWINDYDASFAQRLIAFAIVEGIFFSGAFCAIFWLKEKGKMPGLCFSNELISRDEGLHVEFAVLLYGMIHNKVSKDVVVGMFKEAVEVEKEFITESIPCALLGMNADLMSTYIEFVADRLLVQLGYETVFNVHNPFPFMERISLESKSNFFEQRESSYAKANVGLNGSHASIHEFTLDAEF